MTTTTVITTTMTTRRGKFSTASSLLLLFALLLVTKSFGIMALSIEEGSGALTGVADAWTGDSTIVPEEQPTTIADKWATDAGESGSGVDITTVANEESETTTSEAQQSQTEPQSETTAGPEPETTAQPEPEPTTEPQPVTTTEANVEETTVVSESSPPLIPSSTTEAPADETTTVSEPENTASSSTTEAVVIAPTPAVPPSFVCENAGLFEHISGDCQRYHNCLLNPLTGQLEAYEQICPPLTAYSATYQRCTRDLATCQNDDFNCTVVGRFAGSDTNYYYSCVPSLLGGFHKYRVRCSLGERFEPVFGGCWRYDWSVLRPGVEPLEYSDLAAIKREQKQFKSEDKLRQKALKQQEKLARKQQKELEKQAKKAAKELAKQQAKAEKDKNKPPQSEESAQSVEDDNNQQQQLLPQPESFVCIREGNFARLNPREYFACVSQHGQLLTLRLECDIGRVFNAVLGICVTA